MSSEMRSPVWTARVSSAWSRRPVHLRGRGRPAARRLRVRSREQPALVAFDRDREHSLDDRGVFGMVQRGVAEQGVDRGQPGVAGARAVAASCSRWSRNAAISGASRSAMSRRGRFLPGPGVRVLSSSLERVAVAGDGVRAGVALRDEPVGEERLQRRRERAHGRRRLRCSGGARPAASARESRTGTSRCWPGRRGRGRWTAAAAGRGRRRRCGTSPSRVVHGEGVPLMGNSP